MDLLRGRLITKIDELLAQVVSQETPINSQLQIEANLVLPGDSSDLRRRVVLDSIDIHDLWRHIASQGATPLACTPSAGHTQNTMPHALPNLLGSATAGCMPCTPSTNPSMDMPVPCSSFASGLACPNFSTTLPVTFIQQSQFESSQTPPITPTLDSHSRLLDNVPSVATRNTQFGDHASKGEHLAIDKLIEGMWEQIHNPKALAMGDDLKETMQLVLDKMSNRTSPSASTNLEFSNATKCCRQITTGSRTARAFEVIVQAHWIDCYDARLAAIREDHPEFRLQEQKKAVLNEACTSFLWSEKELRNRMGIWKGYREIKDNAGWCALIFAGPGIYRFCKYRQGFDEHSMRKLRSMRIRAEVAADTLQPQWRQLLSLVGESTNIQWPGHPHDWAVSLKEREKPIPLAMTYHQWDPDFSFTKLEESIVDDTKFGDGDPRRFEDGPLFSCKSCFQRQSNVVEENDCVCFPSLYSPSPRTPTPVQIFRTDNGKNNGLVACCAFEQGQAVGEFIGLITQGLADVDVMQSQAGDNQPYQIWQGRCGNFTRFINHSCAPNCHFETFTWLGVQRIVVVSNGVAPGTELTVDYSSHYWDNLDKICLCGEPCCRYKDRRRSSAASIRDYDKDL